MPLWHCLASADSVSVAGRTASCVCMCVTSAARAAAALLVSSAQSAAASVEPTSQLLGKHAGTDNSIILAGGRRQVPGGHPQVGGRLPGGARQLRAGRRRDVGGGAGAGRHGPGPRRRRWVPGCAFTNMRLVCMRIHTQLRSHSGSPVSACHATADRSACYSGAGCLSGACWKRHVQLVA